MLGNGLRLIHGTWDATGVTAGNIYLSRPNAVQGTSLTTTPGGVSTTLTTSGSYTTSGILPGDVIAGTEIANGTYVASVESATSLTMSENAVAPGTTAGARTFTRPGAAPFSVIVHKISNSVTASSVSCSRLRSGVVSGTHIDLTCTSGDAGWFSVYCQ